MIPNNTRRVEVTNNLGATRTKKLGIDPKNIQFIMELLTNIYSDEELAVIREYSTNALDAQREAGYNGPILVSTPTRLAPFLKIQDFGTGMSADDLWNMYSDYTTSTKRDNADANGFMGIGSKSGLAYGNQFSIVSVKDGVKTSASISRGDDNVPSMDIIDESPSDDPNGTEITIPAKGYDRFQEKAQELFKFWAPGKVLIDGAEPKRDDIEKMTDRIFFHDGDDDYVVMGNVPYPLDRAHQITERGRKVAVYVTMNGDDEVVIHPSREHLIYNGITENVLLGIREEFVAKIQDFITTEIDNATTFVEAFRLIRKYNQEYGAKFTKGLTWKGLDFEDTSFSYDDDSGNTYVHRCTSWQPGKARNSVSTSHLTMEVLVGARFIVVGYPGYNGVSADHKARVRQFMRDNNVDVPNNWGYYDRVIFFKQASLPDPDRSAGFKTYNWSDIMTATKKPKQPRTSTGFSYGGRYDVWDDATNSWKVDAVDSEADILFFSPNETDMPRPMMKRILKSNPDMVFIKASVNRHTKLKREYPNSVEFDYSVWSAKFATEDFDSLTQDQLDIMRAKMVYADGWYYERNYCNVNGIPVQIAKQIADPAYSLAATLYNSPEPVLDYARKDPRYSALEVEWKNDRKTVEQFGKKYPLADWDDYPNETLEYVNAIYNAKEK
jgi:hypothetical protein